MRLNLLIAGLSLSIPALAQEDASANRVATFQNNTLLSDLFWSPAQLWQTTRPTVIAGFANIQVDDKTTTKEFSSSSDIGGQGIIAGLSAPVPGTKAVVGLQYSNINFTSKTKQKTSGSLGDSSDSLKFSRDDTTIRPVGSYAIDNSLSVGIVYEIVSVKNKPDSGDSVSFNYSRLSPGVTFHNDKVEVGVLYSPTININEDDGSETSAGDVLFHSQYAATPTTNIGLVLDYIREKDLDDEANKNIVSMLVATEIKASPLLTTGLSIRYTPAYANEETDRNTNSISSVGLNIFGDYQVTPAASVGAGYQYYRTGDQSGAAEIDDKEVDTNLSQTGSTILLVLEYSVL